jgi:hypothetical protein
MKSWQVGFATALLLLALVACGGSGDEEPDATELLGGLSITVTGLPSDVGADITVTGPSNFSQSVTATTTLANLVPGSYIIEASDVSVDSSSYLVDLSSQTVTVISSQTESVAVQYTLQNQQSIQTEKVFPSGVAVASPTDTFDNTSGGGLNNNTFAPAVMTWTTAYADAVTRINALLNGEVAVNDVFTPELFFNSGVNANCYGPSLLYEDHPDAATPNSGQLPGGDLMIWLETDVASGHTCSAAQLNSRMNGIKNQSFASLMSLASMLFVADSNGESLPEVGGVLDLTEDMNALALTGVSFDTATIEQLSTDQWQYIQNYRYDNGSGVERVISVTLTHTSTESDLVYDGLLAYTVNGDDSLFGGGNCQQNERTLNGSLAYSRESETVLKMQSRVATLCGLDASGFVTDLSASDVGQVDTDNQYDPSSNPDGWSENFNLLGVEMDPNTLAGSYAYVWQAGLGDSHSRIFLMGVNFNESGGTGTIDGEAYAGYGDRVANSDGMIGGLICNWAGPNNDHTLQNFSQRQFFTLDESTGLFTTSAGGSDITYAPTNSCEYDGSGTFVFDSDLDNDLADEVASPAITADLMAATDTDGDTVATMREAIVARGYNLPDIPGGFPTP